MMNRNGQSDKSKTRVCGLKYSSMTLLLLLLRLSALLCSTRTTRAYSNVFDRLRKRPPIDIASELGTSPAFGHAFFDPLGLATEENFARYREVELKHGRVAMLATVGVVLPPLLLTPADGGASFGIAAAAATPPLAWASFVLLVGIIETMVLVPRDATAMPGDYGVGYFGSVDKARHERSLLCELENGRLAMLAFVAQVVLESRTGESVVDAWSTR